MAIPTLLSRNGVTVYPATIPQAIIDPETGKPANLGSDMEYTINNTHADENGNFTITAESLGAATSNHTHQISSIEGLQDELNGKSETNHTHNVVTSVSVGGSSATGAINIVGTGNINVTKSAETITISVTPFEVDVTNAIADANTKNAASLKVFTGTRAEWDTFKATIPNGSRYIVFIRS